MLSLSLSSIREEMFLERLSRKPIVFHSGVNYILCDDPIPLKKAILKKLKEVAAWHGMVDLIKMMNVLVNVKKYKLFLVTELLGRTQLN